MKAVTDFFALRPVFTLWGLRLLWVAFLVQQAITAAAVLGNRGYFSWYGLYPLVTFLLHILVNLVLVRLLIEVAAAILLRAHKPAGRAEQDRSYTSMNTSPPSTTAG